MRILTLLSLLLLSFNVMSATATRHVCIGQGHGLLNFRLTASNEETDSLNITGSSYQTVPSHQLIVFVNKYDYDPPYDLKVPVPFSFPQNIERKFCTNAVRFLARVPNTDFPAAVNTIQPSGIPCGIFKPGPVL